MGLVFREESEERYVALDGCNMYLKKQISRVKHSVLSFQMPTSGSDIIAWDRIIGKQTIFKVLYLFSEWWENIKKVLQFNFGADILHTKPQKAFGLYLRASTCLEGQ